MGLSKFIYLLALFQITLSVYSNAVDSIQNMVKADSRTKRALLGGGFNFGSLVPIVRVPPVNIPPPIVKPLPFVPPSFNTNPFKSPLIDYKPTVNVNPIPINNLNPAKDLLNIKPNPPPVNVLVKPVDDNVRVQPQYTFKNGVQAGPYVDVNQDGLAGVGVGVQIPIGKRRRRDSIDADHSISHANNYAKNINQFTSIDT
ncbi:hypothetical protein I4U23_027282 [Adineta vaga]|nr:hypothetical protein I4U23_027282 [Adineta vaga]